MDGSDVAIVAVVLLVIVVSIWAGIFLVKNLPRQTVANMMLGKMPSDIDEHTELQRLAEAEVAMRDRIAALESILDADTPNWRRAAGQDGGHA